MTASAQGAFSGSLVTCDKTTTGIVAYEGASWNADKGAGPAAYVVNGTTPPLPAGSQKLTTTVKAGTLSMSQAGDAVSLSAVDFGKAGHRPAPRHGDRQGLPGRARGLVPDRQGHRLRRYRRPHRSRRQDRRREAELDPACATKAGSPSTCKAGSAGTVGTSGATLASAPDGTRTGGEFTVDAGLSLDVPAFTPPGSYSGVLTLTLS
ncbi:hypothetical protein SALBM311S_04317 [Streptomyces alboniger]